MKNKDTIRSIVAISFLLLLISFVYIVLKDEAKQSKIIREIGSTTYGIITNIKTSKRAIYYFYIYKIGDLKYENVSTASRDFHSNYRVTINDSVKIMYLKDEPKKSLIIYDTSYIRINYNKYHTDY